MNRTHTLRSVAVRSYAACLTALSIVVTSCGSAPTRIYTIEPVQPHAISTYTGPALRIDAVHVPPALDRTEMLSDLGHGELRIEDSDHWSAPLGQLVRQALTADLIERLPPGQVIFPNLNRPEGALGISVDMLAFSGAGSGAQLTVSWALVNGTGAAPRIDDAIFHARSSDSGTGAAATAQAFSDLIAQLADRIAADLSAQ